MPNHVPPFMDEVLPGLLQNMTLVEVCGDNAECLFDFSETGDIEVGMATLAVENEAMNESLSVCKYNNKQAHFLNLHIDVRLGA